MLAEKAEVMPPTPATAQPRSHFSLCGAGAGMQARLVPYRHLTDVDHLVDLKSFALLLTAPPMSRVRLLAVLVCDCIYHVMIVLAPSQYPMPPLLGLTFACQGGGHP